ncbi:hypothetical protein [Streptomyces sp. NPDC006384]|uniref:hypothetical protein n=1 Tax=Streptomyces sp. NPDC006384 TaxID=3364745 RepID=UPI00369B0AFA
MMGVAPQTVVWCKERAHPYVTYNPWLDRSYCRCGRRQESGKQPLDALAQHQVFHAHAPGALCRCYLPR